MPAALSRAFAFAGIDAGTGPFYLQRADQGREFRPQPEWQQTPSGIRAYPCNRPLPCESRDAFLISSEFLWKVTRVRNKAVGIQEQWLLTRLPFAKTRSRGLRNKMPWQFIEQAIVAIGGKRRGLRLPRRPP